jgi:hypothetical protein
MPEPTTTTLALAVWPPPPTGRQGSYLADSNGKHHIAPDLAARAILAYTDPGDLIVDPDCGIGTVLVEAIQQGRRAIGINPNLQQAALATANISHARQQGAPGRAGVIEGNPDQVPRLIGKAAAILNPAGDRTRVRRHPAGSAQLLLTLASPEPTSAQLGTWASVVAPGGFLLLVHTQTGAASAQRLGAIVAAAEQAGLQYWQHVIALRTSQSSAALLHDDVLSFRKPGAETASRRHTGAASRAVAA